MVCDSLPSWVKNQSKAHPGQHFHTITVHHDGLIAVQIQLPLLTAALVLQHEPGKNVNVSAKSVVAAEPAIQHANTPNVLLVLEIIEEGISSQWPDTVPNRIVSTTRSEKSTTTRHRDANTLAAQPSITLSVYCNWGISMVLNRTKGI